MDAASARSTPSIRRNVAYLMALQAAGYLIPLITLPWMARALGVEQFGRVGFATAVAAYLTLITDYGFQLSATRHIALTSNNPTERSRIFWSTTAAKALMAAGALVALLLSIWLVEPMREAAALLIAGYLAVLASVLTPTWFFQGMEALGAFTAASLVLRALSVPLVLLLVRTPRDAIAAVAIQAGTAVAVGCAGIALLWSRNEIRRVSFSWLDLRRALADGWPLFLSIAAVSLYTSANAVLLRFVANAAAVAYFIAAERIIRAVQSLQGPLTTALFPRVTRLLHDSPVEAARLLRRALLVQGGATLALSVALLLASSALAPLVYGSGFQETGAALAWLSPLPFLIGLSNIFGIQTMVATGHDKALSRIVLLAGVLNVALLTTLGRRFGASGAAASVLAAEVWVTGATAVFAGRCLPGVFWRTSPAETPSSPPTPSC